MRPLRVHAPATEEALQGEEHDDHRIVGGQQILISP
jgi:hypothetical protein